MRYLLSSTQRMLTSQLLLLLLLLILWKQNLADQELLILLPEPRQQGLCAIMPGYHFIHKMRLFGLFYTETEAKEKYSNLLKVTVLASGHARIHIRDVNSGFPKRGVQRVVKSANISPSLCFRNYPWTIQINDKIICQYLLLKDQPTLNYSEPQTLPF